MSAQTAWGDLPENAPIVATPAPAAPVAEPVVSTETAATAESEAAEVAKEEEGVETGVEGLHDKAFQAVTVVCGTEAPIPSMEWTDPALHISPDLELGIRGVGWKQPTPVQVASLLLFHQGRAVSKAGGGAGCNTLMKAPTGTGKSAGFCVAALSMLDSDVRGPQVLIVTPSRPLTNQIHDMCIHLGKEIKFAGKKGVEVAKLYGGSAHAVGPVMQPIVVGCMGTIRMCLRKRWLRLNNIRMFFLDEADSYFDGTEGEIVELKRGMPPTVQLGLFSATFGCLKHPESTTYKFIENIAGTAVAAPTPGRFVPVEVMVEVPIGHKIRVFNLILPADKSGGAAPATRGRGGYHGHRGPQLSHERKEFVYQVVAALAFKLAMRDITFVEAREMIEELSNVMTRPYKDTAGLERRGMAIGSIFGGMMQGEIEAAVRAFATEEVHHMVCTRRAGGVGLNYPNLRAVFVLDIPMNQFGADPDVYTQQVGRIRLPGVAVNVIKSPDDLVKANQVAAELKVAFYDVNMPEDVSIIEAMESFASLLRSQLDELDAIYLPKKA